MTYEQAKSYISNLTREEKLQLNAFLKMLEERREQKAVTNDAG